MKLKFYVLLILFTYAELSSAQSWHHLFGNGGYEAANSVIETSDGGYVFCGLSTSFGEEATGEDVSVVKLDRYGDLAWTYLFETPRLEIAYGLTETPNGDLLIVGGVSPSQGIGHPFLLKLSSGGELISNTYINDIPGIGGFGVSEIIPSSSGGYMISGKINIIHCYPDSSLFSQAFLLMKLDEQLNQEWIKCVGGGTRNQHFKDIVNTSDGGYAILGDIARDSTYDVSLIKVDSNGELEWEKEFGEEWDDRGASIIQVKSGELLIGGTLRNYEKNFVMKLKQDGEVIWQKNYDKIHENFDTNGGFLVEKRNGTVSLITDNKGEIIYRDLDENGEVTNLSNFENPEFYLAKAVREAIPTRGGGVVICGRDWQRQDNFFYAFVVRTDSNFVSTTNHLNQLHIQLYPNPFRHSATLKITDNTTSNNLELEVFSTEGKLIYRTLMDTDEHVLNGQYFNPGIYFYQATNENGQIYRGKFVAY